MRVPSSAIRATTRPCAGVMSPNPAAASPSSTRVSTARLATKHSTPRCSSCSMAPLDTRQVIERIWFDNRTKCGGSPMDTDDVWRHIDQQRTELADLMETFTAEEWETPSLCEGWRVRDVGAHLTLAQSSVRDVLPDMVRARGSFNKMIHDSAVRQAALPAEEYAARVRAMVGSRRTAPFVSDLEPLIDVLGP